MRAKLLTTTFPDNSEKAVWTDLALAPDDGEENQVINLYPDARFQTFEGFGGAFTDSAGYVYSLMPPDKRAELLNAYYGPDGAGYTLGRLHLDSCDFSLAHYEAMGDEADREMGSFTLERSQKYLLPLLGDAQAALGGPIKLMAAPWSPPSFMKSNHQRNGGGRLLDEYYPFWADYLCRYLRGLKAAGCDIRCLTVQNEPKAVQTWDSCIFTAGEEKAFIRDYLYPALQAQGLGEVGLFIWDHNKERVYERARDILDDELDKMVQGVAFHWYSGDHFEAVDLVHRRWPDKKLAQTEACIEYSKFDSKDILTNAQKYAHDTIGNCNAGMTAFYDWNLVLDEVGGPNHVNNYCDAPFLYHTQTGRLEKRNTYAYIAHFSRYIKPGAVRIGHSSYTNDAEVTAFENQDGTTAAVLLNRTTSTLPVNLRVNGELTKFELPPLSISTCLLEG